MDSMIEVQGKQLKLSNLEKVLYPATGFTKQQVIDYYARIAPALLPHLAGRALTRKRYPNGVDGEFFYEKNAPQHRPDWVKTAPIWSEGNHRTVHYILANDLSTLIWLANLAAIELHPSLALAKDITCPTMMVFDLDPGPPANIVQCCQVGLWLREIFEKFGSAELSENIGIERLTNLRPAEHTYKIRIDERVCPRAGAIARKRASRHGGFGYEKATAHGKSFR